MAFPKTITPPPKAGKVGVVITCFNEGAYIGQCVDSVLDQSRPGLVDRIIISDDGSDQETINVLKRLERRDPRITVLYGPGGQRQAAQRNTAVATLDTEYVAILDGDDVWTSDKMEMQCSYLDRHPGVGLVYCDFYTFADTALETARRTGVTDLSNAKDQALEYFLHDPPMVPSSLLIRRETYNRAGGMDPTVACFEDTDFYLRMSQVTRFGLVDAPLVYKRVRSSGITGGRDDLIAYHAFVALKAAATNHTLLPLVPRRLAERARKLANHRLLLGDIEGAKLFSAYALRLRPIDRDVIASSILCRLPRTLVDAIVNTFFSKRVASIRPADKVGRP